MNKPQIKNFSVWARRKLIETVSYRMSLIGIFENRIAEALPQSTANLKFYDIGTSNPAEVKGDDIGYRSELVSKIERDGYKSTVDEIAYTWFNRLIAIRFMEVNDYLPSRVRVLSSLDSEKNEPDIVTEAVSVADENGFDISADEIYRLKDENKADELFGKMFEFQCIQLYSCLPELFQNSENYMEMLLPVSYTDKDGIIYHLVHDIPEDDFNLEKEGQVEIIGLIGVFCRCLGGLGLVDQRAAGVGLAGVLRPVLRAACEQAHDHQRRKQQRKNPFCFHVILLFISCPMSIIYILC